jgi:hypothetical protein
VVLQNLGPDGVEEIVSSMGPELTADLVREFGPAFTADLVRAFGPLLTCQIVRHFGPRLTGKRWRFRIEKMKDNASCRVEVIFVPFEVNVRCIPFCKALAMFDRDFESGFCNKQPPAGIYRGACLDNLGIENFFADLKLHPNQHVHC